MRKLTSLELALIAGGASGDSVTVVGPSPYYPDFGDGGGGGGGGGDSGGGGGGGGDGTPTNPNHACGGEVAPDSSFISQNEGGQRKTGYVPSAGNSGVTIATGVDLGQYTLSGIRNAIDRVYSRYPVNNAYPNFEKTRREAYQTVDSLQPYMGLKGQAAVNALAAHPLNVSSSFANVLDQGIQETMHERVINKFNQASGSNFANLPVNVQTVILDVAHQYGTELDSRTPVFWNQVISGDWNGAYNNLMNFGDIYPTRRHAEAELLKQVIDAGTTGLPNC